MLFNFAEAKLVEKTQKPGNPKNITLKKTKRKDIFLSPRPTNHSVILVKNLTMKANYVA